MLVRALGQLAGVVVYGECGGGLLVGFRCEAFRSGLLRLDAVCFDFGGGSLAALHGNLRR